LKWWQVFHDQARKCIGIELLDVSPEQNLTMQSVCDRTIFLLSLPEEIHSGLHNT